MIICEAKDYDELSFKTSAIIAAQIIQKPSSVLGLATGSSPVGTYCNLSEMYKEGYLDFSKITTINLDEYKGLGANDKESFRYFMNTHLFKHININITRTFIPNGLESDSKKVCREYDDIIQKNRGIDLQLLGLGHNGHIGFNEPADSFSCGTHLVDLTESTLNANKHFFTSKTNIPRQAYTMGIKNIMSAKKIVVIVSGKSKSQILKEVIYGPITPHVPASILQLHPDVTIIADYSALSIE